MNPVFANILVGVVILILLGAALFVVIRQKKNESCGCSSGSKKKCKTCGDEARKANHDCSKGCSGCPFAGSCH